MSDFEYVGPISAETDQPEPDFEYVGPVETPAPKKSIIQRAKDAISKINVGTGEEALYDSYTPAPSSGYMRPFKATAYKSAEAVNTGLGNIAQNVGNVVESFANKMGGGNDNDLAVDIATQKAVRFYANNAEYWHNKANEVNPTILDEMLGEAIGGSVPGVAEFMAGVPYAALTGAARAEKEGNSAPMAAIHDGAKRFVMGKILHAQNVLKQPYRSGVMGGTFAADAAVSGAPPEEIAKAAGIGGLYGLAGNGRVGLREIKEGFASKKPDQPASNPTRDMYKRVIRRELYKVVEEKARESGEGVTDTEEMIRTRLRPLDETTRRGDTMIIPENQGTLEFVDPLETAKTEGVVDQEVPISPEREASTVTERPIIDEKSIPYEVQRIEEEGSDPGGTDKPHGLYTSPSDTTSPHEDLGGKRTTYKTNPDSNILHLGEAGTVSSNRGQFVGESAGIAAARKLIGDADVFRMMGLKKDALVVELQSKYPDIDWSRYYDQHEMVEAVGGIEARRRGYDALYLTDKDPKWNEFVALTDNAFESPVVDPVVETNTTTPPEAVTPTGEPTAKPDTQGNMSDKASFISQEADTKIFNDLYREFGQKGSLAGKSENGGDVSLTVSARDKGKYQVTFFSPMDGQPNGHETYSSPKEAVDAFIKLTNARRPDLPDDFVLNPDAPKEYVYESRTRPVGPGAVPKENFIRTEPGGEFGRAVYSFPLTEKQIEDYNLTPIESRDPKIADLPRAETVTPPLEPEMAAEPDMMGGGSERVTPNTTTETITRKNGDPFNSSSAANRALNKLRETDPTIIDGKIVPVSGDWRDDRWTIEVTREVRGEKEDSSPNTASSFADTGGYTRTERAERDTTEPEVEPKPEPLTPEERADYVSSPRFRLELPEIVEFASRAMGGAFPKLKAFLGNGVRGRFRSDTGKIDILRDLSVEELESVIAHEVGHLQDWLTDKDIARGNILGRIASVPGYMKELLEEYPDAPDKILTKEDRDRFKSEAKSQVESEASDEEIVRTVTREVPKYESVGITPEMILNILRGVTRDPENLLRYLQDVDGSVKKEIAKKAMQDLVDERLQAMAGRRQVGTETVTEEIRTKPKINPEDIKARYEQLLRDEIIKRKLYEKESITEELKALSLEYKPFDPSADPGYTKYRFSSVELYADAFSALFNEPEMFERVAPTFKKAYFNYIERKLELKSIYDELQARQLDPESVKSKRREFIRGMAVEDARIRKERADQIKELNSVTRSKLWHVIKKTLGDKNIRATEIMDAAGKVVDNIPDTDRIDWWIETLPYISSEQYAWQRSIEKDIIADLEKHNLDIIDLHEYMFSNRAATERADIASSGGIMGKYARENLDQMRKDLGKETLSDERFRALESAFNNFRNMYFGSVIQVCKEANFLPKPVMDKMENNPNYATFMDLEHMIDQHMGSGTSAHIYKQHGSLGKVGNTFVHTVLKGSALIRAARHHQVKMAVINSPYIGTVTKAERGPKGVGWSEPSDPNLGLIVVSPEGKPQGYYIDKELADVWKRDPDRASIESRVGLSILGITKSILSGLFIKYNPGWILANPARDIMGTWKKAHDTNGYLAKALWRTYKDAVRAGRGELPERERNLLRKRAIVPDRFYTDEHSISVIEEDFLKSIDDPVAYQNKVMKPINRLMDWLDKYPNPKRFAERQGKKFERWTKFAAEEAINLRDRDKKIQTSDLRKYHTVRTRAGTPDTYARGTLHSWLEFIFPFSNVATQDLRSSVEAYRENKSGYALKTAIANVLPKALFAAATWGMFDFIDDDIKKVAGKAGKYLRRMYSCIPVGLMPNGDAVIITIPQDYAGQTIGALADSILSGDMGGTSLSSLGIVTEGTPYNFNPLLSATKDWAFYWALNIAPKDSFSGRELMSEKVKNAGGMEAAKVLGRETWNDFFGSMIYRFHDDSVTQVNADLKTALGVPPFNAIGRFVRITSQGETERDLDTGKKQRAKEARESIKLGKEKISDINARDKATFSEGANLYTKLVSSGAIDPTETSASAFVKSYNTLGHLKTRNRYIMSIKNARSDGEKAAMLLLWKSELSPSEFNDVTTFLASNKMIGIGALYKAREMGKEKQKEPSVGNFLRKITGGDDSQD